jgi:hypothetical protein
MSANSSAPPTAAAAAAARRRRTTVAARLIHQAPQVAAALDWDTLDSAPSWLSLPEDQLTALQCRTGALLHVRAMQLWIDGARLGAARAVLGEPFLRSLLAQPEAAALPTGSVNLPRIDAAKQVAPLLRAAGASVLLASLPPGPLRSAAAALLAPAAVAEMHAELAQTLIARALPPAQASTSPAGASA